MYSFRLLSVSIFTSAKVVFGRGEAVAGFEAFGEIGRGGKADPAHDFGDAELPLFEKRGGLREADVADEFDRAEAGEPLYLAVDLLGRPAGLFAEGGSGEFRVVDVAIDYVGYFLHKLRVWRRCVGRRVVGRG